MRVRQRVFLAAAAALLALLAAACSGQVAGGSSASAVIGRGRTLAGTSFVASVLGRKHRERSAIPGERVPTGSCPLNVAIAEGMGGVSVVECYSRMEAPVQPRTQCLAGRLTLHMQASDAARSIRLRLSDGHSVVSPLMNVPRRLGGPARLYYQAIGRAGPAPVSLTELATNDRPLRSVAFAPSTACAARTTSPLPGSGRVLAKVRLPRRGTLAIATEDVEILGKAAHGLRLGIEGPSPAVVRSASLRIAQPVPGFRVSPSSGLTHVVALEWEVARICGSPPRTIVYGVLKSAKDEVSVLSDDGHELLVHRVPVPPGAGLAGTLFYALMQATPSWLDLRTPTGQTVIHEEIAQAARQSRCV